ncbi:MAG: hypothetical protein OXE75_13365 [bacterium]|nr:hypothetical protein [bacterium]
MHEVRVYENVESGTRWWAEDDLGFVGGADDRNELLDRVLEWTRCEGILDQEVEFVSMAPELPPSAPSIGLDV